jgi:hypothetical protein
MNYEKLQFEREIIWDEVPTMVEIAIFSISLLASISCTGNDTPETNTWLNIYILRSYQFRNLLTLIVENWRKFWY